MSSCLLSVGDRVVRRDGVNMVLTKVSKNRKSYTFEVMAFDVNGVEYAADAVSCLADTVYSNIELGKLVLVADGEVELVKSKIKALVEDSKGALIEDLSDELGVRLRHVIVDLVFVLNIDGTLFGELDRFGVRRDRGTAMDVHWGLNQAICHKMGFSF